MRRINYRQRRRQAVLKKYREFKRLLEAYHQKRQNIERNSLCTVKVFQKGTVKPKRVRARKSDACMPANFCITENFEAVVGALVTLRKRMEKDYQRYRATGKKPNTRQMSWIDISTISRITPSSALVLTSEFDRMQSLTGGGASVINVDRWNNDVFTNFFQLGLFSILNIVNPGSSRRVRKFGKNILLQMRSSDLVDPQQAVGLFNEIQGMIDHVEPTGLDAEASRKLRAEIVAILNEAMENVATHAYRDGISLDFTYLKRWWLTAAWNTENKKLTVVMYDQGVSIPVSLPHWENYAKVELMFARFGRMIGGEIALNDGENDGLAIRVAMKVAVSATREKHRGKGLPEMKRFIDTCKDGRLRIISRRGEYVYQKFDKPRVFNHAAALGGTLIEWEVTL